jgi:hypothetical protein
LRNQVGAARVFKRRRATINKRGHEVNAMGRTRWAIAEGHIPSQSSFTDRALVSHETACILNAGASDAQVSLTFFSPNRPALIASPCRHAARCTCGSTILWNHHRFRETPIFPRDSNRMFRLSCNIHGSIHDTPK